MSFESNIIAELRVSTADQGGSSFDIRDSTGIIGSVDVLRARRGQETVVLADVYVGERRWGIQLRIDGPLDRPLDAQLAMSLWRLGFRTMQELMGST